MAIAKNFAEKNRTVYLAFPKINDISSILQDAPIEICEFDFSLVRAASNDPVKRFIQSHQIGYIYVTAYPYCDINYIRLKGWGVKKIIHHDHAPGERPRVRGLKRIIKKLVLSIPDITCDLYIGVSRFVRDRLISNVCLPVEKCKYILNGIHPYNVPLERTNYVKQEFNLPQENILIVNTGRADYYKGIDFIIDCADYLINKKGVENISFIYCGDGPNLDDFITKTRELNLGNQFIFAGYRKDLRSILPSCDIAFHASDGEAFSLSILEYMSAGCVTIAPDNCGNGEAINNKSNGFLYPTRDLHAAVKILEDTINNAILRREIAATAQNDVRVRFDLKRADQELVDVLSPILNK